MFQAERKVKVHIVAVVSRGYQLVCIPGVDWYGFEIRRVLARDPTANQRWSSRWHSHWYGSYACLPTRMVEIGVSRRRPVDTINKSLYPFYGSISSGSEWNGFTGSSGARRWEKAKPRQVVDGDQTLASVQVLVGHLSCRPSDRHSIVIACLPVDFLAGVFQLSLQMFISALIPKRVIKKQLAGAC